MLLLGLGMDYNIFILTRIREEAAKGQHQNDAIVHAIQQTGGIITAAAIILAGSLGHLDAVKQHDAKRDGLRLRL